MQMNPLMMMMLLVAAVLLVEILAELIDEERSAAHVCRLRGRSREIAGDEERSAAHVCRLRTVGRPCEIARDRGRSYRMRSLPN